MRVMFLSYSVKHTFLLVEECLHAVLLVLGGKAAAECPVLVHDGIVHWHVILGIDALLGGLYGQRGVGGYLVCQF